jgi:AcrR family transcriptional regulator
LLEVGKERLTTTRVAVRAGESVGTLYQYFPTKSALLEGALKRHLAAVTEAVELVCQEQEGETLRNMAAAQSADVTGDANEERSSEVLDGVRKDTAKRKI